jgi:chromosomal replication initiation ATPase DnaA
MNILAAYCEFFGIKLEELPAMRFVDEETLCNIISKEIGLVSEFEPSIRFNPRRIFKIICDFLGREPEYAMMPNRKPEFRECRHIFYYLMVEISNNNKNKYRISLANIGKSLACDANPRGFDHSTVIFGHTSIGKSLDQNPHTKKPNDPALKKLIDEIWEKI